VTWRYGRWSVDHPLPVGAARLAPESSEVRAGDTIASGAFVTTVRVVEAARQVGVASTDLDRVLRVRPVVDVRRGAILARTGRRFARAATAPIDGRLVHVTVDGDLLIAPVVDEWRVRSTIDGVVTRSDAAAVTVDGECWALQGLAGYGPDAIGELALAVDTPDDPLAPGRIDVRLQGRILVGGARIAAEAITRAHAVGVAGLIAGAAPAGGLRVVYGDDVDARGAPSVADRPTVLCLTGFGSGALPREIWEPLVSLAGERASIHTASARLFALAAADRLNVSDHVPLLALADDHASVRPVAEGEEPGPNVLPYDAER
jgi:hypothetical protein